MAMIRCKFKTKPVLCAAQLLIRLFLPLVFIRCKIFVRGSEYPDRECCDPIYPFQPSVEPLPPLPTVDTILTLPAPGGGGLTSYGKAGPNVKTAIAILNCILARQLCFEDPSCSAILEIIPRVCGPVPVACSTVTVTKCQAALKTLQAFPFFRPTCLCKEPGIDPDCNNFRDFLFDHPCGFVLKKEKDPYPVDALPTCNHALAVCQQERKCIKLFENFKLHCKVRDNKCRMDDRNLCHEAWTNLRLSPMFGCICPNNHMKRRCDRIFSMVNHNPCVEFFQAQDVSFLKTAQLTTIQPLRTKAHVTIPLIASTAMPQAIQIIPIALGFDEPVTQVLFHPPIPFAPSNQPYDFYDYDDIPVISSKRIVPENRNFSIVSSMHEYRNNYVMHQHPHQNSHDTENMHHHFNTRHHDKHTAPLLTNYESPWNPQVNIREIVQAISVQESYHRNMFDENMALVEMPLVAPISSHYTHHRHNTYYPYNLSSFPYGGAGGGSGGGPAMERVIFVPDAGSRENLHKSAPDQSPDVHTEIIRIHFQSTCHTAMTACKDDSSCLSSVQPVLMHCDLHRCNQNACMDALQSFYRAAHEDLSLDVAFCLCKKTSNRHDVCMIAQEKLHPMCAQRPPDAINAEMSNGAMHHPPPACHTVADICKEDEECRVRLEHYEQACAVDSVTKKCAGRPSGCRTAMLGILGTPLRTSCACQGTDVQQLYECLGWHRLLWLNPCVVESQKDFHIKRLAELGLLETTTSTSLKATTTKMMPSSTYLQPTRPRITIEIPRTMQKSTPTKILLDNNSILDSLSLPPLLPDSIPETLLLNGNEPNGNINEIMNGNSGEQFLVVFTAAAATAEAETTTTSTTATTTIASTGAPRFCVVQRPQQSDQLISVSSTRRIYTLDDAECSELCSCTDALTLTCHALCVPFTPCRTAFAFYSHASPAYQAFRGRCLCYSGRFICMRPPPGEYVLPGGIFLLLGYSSTEEALLRPYTNLGVQDTIRGLQHYLLKNISNDAQCTLLLEKISHQVNSQHSELAAHRLLSIFKMAEVQIVWPEVNGNACSYRVPTHAVPLLPVLLFVLVPVMQLICGSLICDARQKIDMSQRTRHLSAYK